MTIVNGGDDIAGLYADLRHSSPQEITATVTIFAALHFFRALRHGGWSAPALGKPLRRYGHVLLHSF